MRASTNLTVAIALALIVSIAGCASSESASTTTSTSTPTTTAPASATTAAPTTTAMPTTTAPPPPAVEMLQASAPGVYEFDWAHNSQGWPYRARIEFGGQDANATGCLDTAPPQQTYVTFTMTVSNLLTDRPARPDYSGLSLEANVGYGGKIDPSGEIGFDNVGLDSYAAPAGQGAAFPCMMMGTPGGSDIPAGGSKTYQGWIGPLAMDAAATREGLILEVGTAAFSGTSVQIPVPG